jgi:GTP cyclohydrolase I
MAAIYPATQGMERPVATSMQAAQAAVRTLISWLGEDPNREGLRDTPARVARAMREMTSGYRDRPGAILARRFAEDSDEMIVVRGISFQSLCEHHLLPFHGRAHVAYLPGPSGGVVGLSKLARLVECYARRLQVQERMTRQIARDIMEHLEARGAAVLIEASHACMINRGVRQPASMMVTSAVLGSFRDDARARSEFFSLAAPGG